MIKNLAVFALAVTASFVTHADVTIQDFRTLLESDRPRAVQLIESIGTAYTWANAVLYHDRKDQLFCVAKDKVIDANELIQVLESDYKKYEADYKKGDTSLIEVILLQGLERAYPCPTKTKTKKKH